MKTPYCDFSRFPLYTYIIIIIHRVRGKKVQVFFLQVSERIVRVLCLVCWLRSGGVSIKSIIRVFVIAIIRVNNGRAAIDLLNYIEIYL